MKAIVQEVYGIPGDVLQLKDVEAPVAKDDEVLVRVHAAGVNYTQEDFTRSGQRYDLILDNVGNHSSTDLRRVLTLTGVLLPNSGGHASGRWIGPLGRIASDSIASLFVRQQGRTFLSLPNKQDLATLQGMVESGCIKPVIDRTYSLSETVAALEHVGKGHVRGKVVVTLA